MVDPVAKWLYSYTVWASCRSSYLSLIFVKCSQIRQKKKKKWVKDQFEYSHYLSCWFIYEFYGEKLHVNHFWELKG